MRNSEENGCLGIVLLIFYVGSWISTGMLAWDWVDPKGFWGTIAFLIVWSILGTIFHGILMFLGTMLAQK